MNKPLTPGFTALVTGLLALALLAALGLAPRAGEAQTIAYKPPTRGAPSGVARVGGGTRGPNGWTTLLVALVPDHVGLTVSEQPALYWFTSKAVDTPVEMTLLREGGVQPELELALSPPIAPGIHKLDLAAHAIRLEPGVPYQWYVAVVLDPAQRSNDIVVGGEILQVPAAPELDTALSSSGTHGAAAVFARSGLWYDALGALSAQLEAAPGDVGLRVQRATLLEQGGLAEAARYEREAKL